MSETRENGKPWWPEELITREGKYADFLLVGLDAPSCTHFLKNWAQNYKYFRYICTTKQN